jgi:hypothetical protein
MPEVMARAEAEDLDHGMNPAGQVRREAGGEPGYIHPGEPRPIAATSS